MPLWNNPSDKIVLRCRSFRLTVARLDYCRACGTSSATFGRSERRPTRDVRGSAKAVARLVGRPEGEANGRQNTQDDKRKYNSHKGGPKHRAESVPVHFASKCLLLCRAHFLFFSCALKSILPGSYYETKESTRKREPQWETFYNAPRCSPTSG